jgi:hypothetical protein
VWAVVARKVCRQTVAPIDSEGYGQADVGVAGSHGGEGLGAEAGVVEEVGRVARASASVGLMGWPSCARARIAAWW